MSSMVNRMMNTFFSKKEIMSKPEMKRYEENLNEILIDNKLYNMHDVYNMLSCHLKNKGVN